MPKKAASSSPSLVVDPTFAPTEHLYRRIPPPAWDRPERLSLDQFDMPDMSVNREKYGPPEDAIKAFPGWGVVQFQVWRIPKQMSFASASGHKLYSFQPAHVPEVGNPSHSEVHAHCDNKRVVAPPLGDDKEAMYLWRWKLRSACTARIVPNLAIFEQNQAKAETEKQQKDKRRAKAKLPRPQ